jgi:RsiW-degrading membrane proteinase PrsW (M82 family)
MFIAFILQVVVCVLILRWLLKKKPGQPFSRKMVWKLTGAGALAVILGLIISLGLNIKKDTFFHLNPILAGFLTALLTAALLEEGVKFVMFRLAMIKNKEVTCWLDAVIAGILVGIGFTLLEDVEFAISGATNILRAIIPGHLLFQGLMGYFYGKARVTKKPVYDVLSLVVPILAHTFFDMFLIAEKAILGDFAQYTSLTEEQLTQIPNWEYTVPLLVCAIAAMIITFIALVVMLRKIGVWSKNGELQEALESH